MKLALIAALGRAVEGQTVGWIGHRWSELSDHFQDADNLCRGEATRIHRMNGAQEITFPSGGRILFLNPNSSRGISLHSAYVPAGASEQLLEAVIPTLDTTGGPLIAY